MKDDSTPKQPEILAIIEDLRQRIEILEAGPQLLIHYADTWLGTGAACGQYIRAVRKTTDPLAVTCRSCRRTTAWARDSGQVPDPRPYCQCNLHPYPARVCVTLGNLQP